MNDEARINQFRRKQENYMLVIYTAIDKLNRRKWYRQISREFSIYVPFVVLFCLFVTYCNNTKVGAGAACLT